MNTELLPQPQGLPLPWARLRGDHNPGDHTPLDPPQLPPVPTALVSRWKRRHDPPDGPCPPLQSAGIGAAGLNSNALWLASSTIVTSRYCHLPQLRRGPPTQWRS
ncbi:hypothetical protein GWK47_047857 [Chionoecetes opilio]|uniref:Uncharacterized protein n=1 Tax=Chionoecetes opilio TaxID=41210 RepID=A0A8J4Y4C1_CHIOP|nr:hypothetical protein GWK47_047857 [Chionoecetes opilio]